MGFLDGALNPLRVPVYNDAPQEYEPHLRKRRTCREPRQTDTVAVATRANVYELDSFQCPSYLPVTLHLS